VAVSGTLVTSDVTTEARWVRYGTDGVQLVAGTIPLSRLETGVRPASSAVISPSS
jgi:hypothetical protein